MATASKSSRGKARGKSSPASKRAAARGGNKTKSASKKTAATKRSAGTKPSVRSTAPRKKAASKRVTTRAVKKQSPVTRIKRVATSVIQQGATAAKQGVHAVERLVEEVKDRVTS
jgi:RNA polymerase primary sigma factor